MYLLVFHYTDTDISILFLPLVLSLHNKQNNSLGHGSYEQRKQITYSHLTLSNLSSLLLVPILSYPFPPINPVCVSLFDPSVLSFRLSYQTLTPLFMYSLQVSSFSHNIHIFDNTLPKLYLNCTWCAFIFYVSLASLSIIVLTWHFFPWLSTFLFWCNKIYKNIFDISE